MLSSFICVVLLQVLSSFLPGLFCLPGKCSSLFVSFFIFLTESVLLISGKMMLYISSAWLRIATIFSLESRLKKLFWPHN